MGSDVEQIKGRVDIQEVVSGYTKLEKAGINFKARCPFHQEKTPSFFVSPVRQNYHCFGCGAQGDIFTFVEEMEGVDFREALKILADKAGIELSHRTGESKTERDEVQNAILDAVEFFEMELGKHPEVRKYLDSRGLTGETIQKWRIGYAPGEWRALHSHLISLGHSPAVMIKAGLVKRPPSDGEGKVEKSPYDVFRDRIMFPLSDASGRVIAFSGRAFAKDTEPKYLNTPDTILFTKSEVLYGLDRAKESIRRQNYAVLVEGQMDMVLSHQAGVENVVATSGTAFTRLHLERLRRLSTRMIIAFDNDPAGEKAAQKSAELGLSMGLDIKVASLPLGSDPADLVVKDSEAWKDALRQSSPAVEYFLERVLVREKDARKAGKLVGQVILPMIALISSAIERAHFISVVSKRTSIREEVLWADLKNIKLPQISLTGERREVAQVKEAGLPSKSHAELVRERLAEIKLWKEELEDKSPERDQLDKEEAELIYISELEGLRERQAELSSLLNTAERSGDEGEIKKLSQEMQKVNRERMSLEDRRIGGKELK